MADFETGDVVRLGVVQTFDNEHDIVNVLHLLIIAGGPMTFATASLDFQEYVDDLYTPLASLLSDLQDADHISAANVTQDLVFGNFAFDTYTGGSNIADALPPTDTLLAFGRTSRPRVQIRKYLGVFCEGDQADGLWSSTVRAAGLTYINYHIAQQTMTNGLVLQGVAYNRTAGTSYGARSGSTSQAVCTQRRRRRGRGS
jgi:hypothetical protein